MLVKERKVRSRSFATLILQIKNEMIIREWPSICEAALHFGVNHGCIRKAINRQNNFYKGYNWKYKEFPDFEGEIWKKHPIHPIRFSNLGRISRDKTKFFVKPSYDCYAKIKIQKRNYSVSRLILETFRPNENSDNLVCDHLNEIKNCNALFNLEWVTRQENGKRSHRTYQKQDTTKKLVTEQWERIWDESEFHW